MLPRHNSRILWILVVLLISTQTYPAQLASSPPTSTVHSQTVPTPTLTPTTLTSALHYPDSSQEIDRSDNTEDFEFANEDDEAIAHDAETDEPIDQQGSLLDHYQVLNNKTANLNDFYQSLNSNDHLPETIEESSIHSSNESGGLENRNDLFTNNNNEQQMQLYSQLSQMVSSINNKNKVKGKKSNGKSKKLQIVYIKVPLINLLDKGKAAELSGVEGTTSDDYDSTGGSDPISDTSSTEVTTENALSAIAQLANSKLQHQPASSTTQQLFQSLMNLKQNYLNSSAVAAAGSGNNQATSANVVQHNNHQMLPSQFYSTWLPIAGGQNGGGNNGAIHGNAPGQPQALKQTQQQAQFHQNQGFQNQPHQGQQPSRHVQQQNQQFHHNQQPQQNYQQHHNNQQPYNQNQNKQIQHNNQPHQTQQQFHQQQNYKQTTNQITQQSQQKFKLNQPSQSIASNVRYPIQPQKPNLEQHQQHAANSVSQPNYQRQPQQVVADSPAIHHPNATVKYWNTQWKTSPANHTAFKSWSMPNQTPKTSSTLYAAAESANNNRNVAHVDHDFSDTEPSSRPPHNHVYQPAIHGAFTGPLLDDIKKVVPSAVNETTSATTNKTAVPAKKRSMGLGILPIVIQIDTKAMREEQQQQQRGLTDQRFLENHITGLNFNSIFQQLEHNNLHPHRNHHNLFNHNQGYQSSASAWSPTSDALITNNRTQFPNAPTHHRNNWPTTVRPYSKPTATITIEKPYPRPIPPNHDLPDDSQWPNKVEFISKPFPSHHHHHSNNAPWIKSQTRLIQPKFVDYMQQQASTSTNSKHPIFDDVKEFPKANRRPKACRQAKKSPCSKAPSIEFDDVFFSKMPSFDSAFFGKPPNSKFQPPNPFTSLGRHLAYKRRNKQKMASAFLTGGTNWNVPPNSLFYGNDFLPSASDFAPFFASPSIPIEAFLPPPPPPSIAPRITMSSITQTIVKPEKMTTPKKATEPEHNQKAKKFRFWSPFSTSRTDKTTKLSKIVKV